MSAERVERIRETVFRRKLKMYQVADALGVSYQSLNRWMRNGITEERYELVMAAIDSIDGKGGC